MHLLPSITPFITKEEYEELTDSKLDDLLDNEYLFFKDEQSKVVMNFKIKDQKKVLETIAIKYKEYIELNPDHQEVYDKFVKELGIKTE